jgi:hypothetical protein
MGAISSAAIAAPVDPDPLPNARFDDELRMLKDIASPRQCGALPSRLPRAGAGAFCRARDEIGLVLPDMDVFCGGRDA